ncbi:MAG TPA: M48 family metallopeptidase [Verrucomicrobiae bacterium]|jgi:predicted Zn-dependent protease|nr:M48 family metallopeptidase [Verrucomicrobiae bacterium]
MIQIPRVTLGLTVAGLLAASVALASPQAQQSSQSPTPTQSQPPGAQQPASTQPAPTAQSGQDPSQTQPQTQAPAQPAPPQPAPPPPAQTQAPQDQPVAQQDTVHPKNSKEDVDAIGNRNIGKGPNFYSLEREIALGKQLAQEVERSSKLIDDPVVTEYVNRVGQNLVRNSDAKVPFTIKVIDSDEVNAFALPGGFFYVNSGLILRAEEESELAGVMAHEISHVCARHGTKNATKGEAMQLAMIPLMLLGPGGWAGYGIYEAASLAIPVTYLKFSRDSEREADYLGVEYMYKAGYDPNSYVTFFERIQADEKRRPGTIPKVFSTHPPTPDRIEATQKEIARILPAKQEYIVTTSEFDSVKARLRNIMFARKATDNQPGKPTLRTKTAQSTKQPTSTTDPNATTSDGSDDDRPTLKRRPDQPNN